MLLKKGRDKMIYSQSQNSMRIFRSLRSLNTSIHYSQFVKIVCVFFARFARSPAASQQKILIRFWPLLRN